MDRPHPQPPSFARQVPDNRQKGFALAAALLAVLLIGALVAVVLFATTEETREGSATAERQLSLNAAESAIELAIGGLGASPLDSIGIGGTRSHGFGGLGASVIVYITRLDSSLYWIVAAAGGESSTSGASRRIGVVVRAQFDANHSITIDRIPEGGWSELF